MSNDFEFEPPDELDNSGGNYLKKAGRYHLNVLDFFNGETYKKTVIDGFSVTLEVLDGDQKKNGVCTEKGKLYYHTFFNPNPGDTEDQVRRAKQAQAAFLIATNAIGLEHLAQIRAIAAARASGEPLPKLSIDLSKCKAMQCTAYLSIYNDKLRINFDNIWHVDDAAASDIPLDAGALSLLPANLRRTPEQLQQIKDAFGPKKAGATNGSHKPAPAKSAVNLDDI